MRLSRILYQRMPSEARSLDCTPEQHYLALRAADWATAQGPTEGSRDAVAREGGAGNDDHAAESDHRQDRREGACLLH